jgi:hypothetical protein
MKIQNVLNCQFQVWYPLFKEITIKSKIFKLDNELLQYLREDGMIIHDDYVQVTKGLGKISFPIALLEKMMIQHLLMTIKKMKK